MLEIDLELSLQEATIDDFDHVYKMLPDQFQLVDRIKNGWGLVVINNNLNYSDVDHAILNFFQQLSNSNELIKKYNGILRIALYHDTANCTFRLGQLKKISLFDVPIEFSIYPSS